MKKLKLFFLLLILVNAAWAQQPAFNPADIKEYYLVFLKKGPDRSHDSLTAATIQKEHLAHLGKMHESGKMCMAGPVGGDEEIRGICIYNVGSKEEAASCASADPAVKAGRLVVEVRSWYALPGSKLP
ncbi:MAG: hypothetical protein JNL88_01255 [Bacteroidia bacterium]|nr:hypothetical protein [Bacteroidia bacterium]